MLAVTVGWPSPEAEPLLSVKCSLGATVFYTLHFEPQRELYLRAEELALTLVKSGSSTLFTFVVLVNNLNSVQGKRHLHDIIASGLCQRKGSASGLSLALASWPCDGNTVPFSSALSRSRSSTWGGGHPSSRDYKSRQETKCTMFLMVHIHKRKRWKQTEHHASAN